MSSSAGAVIVTPDSARTLVDDDVGGSLVRQVHADPDDDGESFVDGHDLSEQTRDLRVADDQVVRPLERRSHATESHEGGARRERHAGDDELELVRSDVRTQEDRAQQRRPGGRLPSSIQSTAPGALEVGDGHETFRRALGGPSGQPGIRGVEHVEVFDAPDD